MEFKDTMFLPSSATGAGLLCPDQRRMPQIGSLFAEMLAMPVLFLRLPLVVVVASPVMLQLLTGPCYLDSKSHSLLMNCGREIFSLEDFFASAYACNGHFWRIIAIVANFLEPGFAQTFLNGMAAIGENSGVSSFMPGIMSAFSQISKNDPSEGVSKVQDLLTGGASRFGVTSIMMKTALNPIAGAHWIWRISSGIVVQIIQATQAQRSIGSVFWNVLYDGRVDYKELVAKRMFNTCGGFALMAGYSTPIGSMILHYCFAGVKSTTATLDLLSIFLVDIPIMACVCKGTAGNNPSDWILHNCDSPDGLKPLLRRLMDEPNSCSAIIEQTNKNLTTVFDDTFGELFAGTTSVGSILDSLLQAVDGEKAGQCDNFDSNPYVVTLIPEPADYWRVCGNTDFCKIRCQQQMEAFDAVKPTRALRSTTSTQTVQSLFFPTLNADAYNPFTSVNALSEMNGCELVCADREDRCFVMAGFVGANGLLRVAQYCVPSALARGVSKGGQWDTFGVSGLIVDLQFIRVSTEGGWVDAYAVAGLQDQLVQVCLRLVCSEFVPSDLDPGVVGFQQMQAIGDVAVFQVRTMSEGTTSYCLRFSGQWRFSACGGTNLWDQSLYYMVLNAKSQVMLVPYDEVPLQLCQLDQANMALVGCTRHAGFQRQNVPVKSKGLRSQVSQYMTVDYSLFVASNDASHWLTMIFVSITSDYASAMVSNSMPVTLQYTLQQGCSLDSCVGCTQLSVQRLCFAAQQCQVARCVGSQVNQLRPLCAIGGVAESQIFAILAALQGVWNMISSTLVLVLDLSGGITPPAAIAWPDQAFYGLVCSLKDSVASTVSILTSAVNGLVQASMPLAMLAHGDAVDNSFLATFTLTMMAITKFLYQLALAPLYAAIAVQKVVICQANSLIGAVSGNNAITIGDPAIQSASSSASGMCMTQLHGENSQGLNSGMDSNQAFVSGSSQVLTQLGGLALELPLDALIHPMDVFFTYILGVVIGLQDVLQTADQRK
jgi:hypothetical protein